MVKNNLLLITKCFLFFLQDYSVAFVELLASAFHFGYLSYIRLLFFFCYLILVSSGHLSFSRSLMVHTNVLQPLVIKDITRHFQVSLLRRDSRRKLLKCLFNCRSMCVVDILFSEYKLLQPFWTLSVNVQRFRVLDLQHFIISEDKIDGSTLGSIYSKNEFLEYFVPWKEIHFCKTNRLGLVVGVVSGEYISLFSCEKC